MVSANSGVDPTKMLFDVNRCSRKSSLCNQIRSLLDMNGSVAGFFQYEFRAIIRNN